MSSERLGIVSYATYVPVGRLSGAELSAALGSGPSRGSRSLASYDEDTTTMGVEAARHLLDERAPGALYFATTAPAYADKTNATAIHAALDLGHSGLAGDIVGSARGATLALGAAEASAGIAVFSDLRSGRPGSGDERGGGDAAVAIRFGGGADAIATIIGRASTSAEFLDRWRTPGAFASDLWEERFGQEVYLPLIAAAVGAALADAAVEAADHVVISCPHARVAAAATAAHGGDRAVVGRPIGYSGCADAALKLSAALDIAKPSETILIVNAVDGADAFVFRVGGEPGAGRRGPALPSGDDPVRQVGYATYLTWRGLIERELPRRPEPDRPAGPPSARSEAWKFGFVGSACDNCGRVHVPPKRVCTNCGETDRMQRRRLAESRGRVATFTVDRLAYSPSPPMIDAVVDFDGGGRYTLEVTDAAPEAIAIGVEVAMTFRRLYTSGGVHNYFWKAKPVAAADATAAAKEG